MMSFSKFTFYIAFKWLTFYIYQFTTGGGKWSFDKVNGEGLFLTAFMLLVLPLVEIFVLYLPFHFALKQRGWLAILILFFNFGLEFLIGWFGTNSQFAWWMAVKIFLSVILFVFFFRKHLYRKLGKV